MEYVLCGMERLDVQRDYVEKCTNLETFIVGVGFAIVLPRRKLCKLFIACLSLLVCAKWQYFHCYYNLLHC